MKKFIGRESRTSQLFGNIYLNSLDHFIKRDLKIRCYGRYVDDMYLIHSDKRVLKQAITEISKFLKDRLKLICTLKKLLVTRGYFHILTAIK